MAKSRNLDWILFGLVVALLVCGLIFCYSASSAYAGLRGNNEWLFIGKQFLFAVVGLGFLFVLSRMDYRRWNDPSVAFLAMGLSVIAVVIAMVLDGAAHRWIRTPLGQLQPSEFAKPALIVFCAFFIARRLKAINNKHTVLPAAVVVGILGAAVVIGDLGTAVVLVTTAALLFFVAGLQWRYIGIAVAIACIGLVVAVAMKPYRVLRLIGHFDPKLELVSKISPEMAKRIEEENRKSNRDPSYQGRQAEVAIGSGGLTGLGIMEGKQKFLYLPAAHTDFIYAVIGEEGGLIGSILILFLFLGIAWRGLRIFFRVQDPFGQYLALGITLLLLFQTLINISVVLSLIPNKGIPLPMISYGGSALLSALICLGMLLSVSEHA